MEKVVDKMVGELQAQLSEKRIQVDVTRDARKWLAQKGYDPEHGARPLSRLIQEVIKDKIADAILFGGLKQGAKLTIYCPSEDEIDIKYQGPSICRS